MTSVAYRAATTAAPALLALAILVATTGLTPPRAHACGGFFCDNNQPVNQAAERIIFSQNGDGTVTAVVEILYQGPSERFAWVLPVPGTPDVGISSATAFTRLQAQTNPVYRMNTAVEGTCREEPFPSSADAGAAGAFDMMAGDDDDDEAAPPVVVLDSGTVGPFDFETIGLDPALPNPGDVAIEWLDDNGYDVSAFGGERLGPYLADGMNLIAFRLRKGTMAGSIRPIVLTYDSDHPMIPIRPTAVAANDDMGVLVWMLGGGRAVPTNYKSLVVNEALIDWFRGGSNYDAVVTEAANEAEGQGFVTELAISTSTLTPVFRLDEEPPTLEELGDRREIDVLEQVSRRYAGFDGILDAATETVPVPPDATIQDVLNCLSCFFNDPDGKIDGFEVGAFLDALETWVVGPMRETQEILDAQPYVTRLYTTMSADEMTVDPEFDLNMDLGDVSNVHVAERVIECNRRVTVNQAPWRATLENGDVVRGVGNRWPFQIGDAADLPANRRIEQASTVGANTVVSDNALAIQAALDAQNASVPGELSPSGGGASCATVGPRPDRSGLAAALAVAATLLVARRRRHRG